jgi:DNA-binding response OmpR family regulator
MSEILVVDDDRTVGDIVVRYLTRAGHRAESEPDASAALDRVLVRPPDLLVLDVTLPGMSGLELCRRVREVSAIPIIMLTARGAEEDRVAGLQVGADDYVTKPFSPREFVLRVNAVLRRSHSGHVPANVILSDDDLTVDTAAHEVTLAGRKLALTEREYRLLVFFLRHPRKAFSREQLLDRVWDWTFGDVSTVTVHVRRLREKIEADPGTPARLLTVWGVGYRYEPAIVQPELAELDVA